MNELRYARIDVIYDTSYLIGTNGFLHERLFLHDFIVTSIVPDIVVRELDEQIRSGRKPGEGQRGRGRILDLQRKILSEPWPNDHMPNMAVRFETPTIDVDVVRDARPLGPDSMVDEQLIAYALRRLGEDPYRVVIIASGDGGIGMKVQELRMQGHMRLVRIGRWDNNPGDQMDFWRAMQSIGWTDPVRY